MANFKNPSPKTIVKMAREKILDESMNDAIVFLMDCLDGMDVHTARQILLGHWNITEDFDLDEKPDYEWQEELAKNFESVYKDGSEKKFFEIISMPSTAFSQQYLDKLKYCIEKGDLNNYIEAEWFKSVSRKITHLELKEIGDVFNSSVVIGYLDIPYDENLPVRNFSDYAKTVKKRNNDIFHSYDKDDSYYQENASIDFYNCYWLDKDGNLTRVNHYFHEKYCDEVKHIPIEIYEKNNVRIHYMDSYPLIGKTSYVALTEQKRYTDKQLEVLMKMPWVKLDPDKL